MKEILKYIQLYTGCNDHTLKRIKVMLEPRLNLEPLVIEKVVERVLTRQKRPKEPLAQWSDKYFINNNCTYEYIAQQKRLQEIVDDRNLYIKEAFFAGYRPTEIARFLKRNHSTILYVISK